jgi:hypothetical protein
VADATVNPVPTPTPGQPTGKRGRSVVGIVFLMISLALFGIAGYHIVRLVQKGYQYACNGDGCAYDTPEVSSEVGWISATIPFAIIALAVSIMAFTFHRIRKAFGSQATYADYGGFSTLPLIAKTLSGVFAQIRAAHGGAAAWPGMPGAPPGGVIQAGESGPGTGTGVPGMGAGWPGVSGTGWPGAAAGTTAPGDLLGTAGAAASSGPPGASAGADPNRAETIRAMGLDGEAVISGMHDVGMVSGTRRMYELDLAVTVPGQATYHVKHMTWVPVGSIGRLYAGGRLRAKVDPVDRNSLVLDLNTPAN